MRVQLESIDSKDKGSFSTMVNPRMSDLFFWHFHPEYELVFISGANGTRHVGEHISTYEGSDLVLIGSNIPHLNFDYGIQTEYDKVVVHLQKDFVEAHIRDTPELQVLNALFKLARHGIAFRKAIQAGIGNKLFALQHLSGFQRYLHLLDILHLLAREEEVELLHPLPYQNQYSNREQERLRKIYAFVDQNFHRKIELDEVAEISNLTREAFCRYFKKMTKYTFIEFLNRYRISKSKRYLMSGKSVSDACYSSGFESLSYYNRIFKRITDENPRDFRKKYTS